MTEATTQTEIQNAIARSHQERGKAFRAIVSGLRPRFAARPRKTRIVTA